MGRITIEISSGVYTQSVDVDDRLEDVPSDEFPANFGFRGEIEYATGIVTFVGGPTIPWHVALQIPDDGHGFSNAFVHAWIGNILLDTPQPAFDAELKLSVAWDAGHTNKSVDTRSAVLYPFTMLLAAVSAGSSVPFPTIAYMQACMHGGPSIGDPGYDKLKESALYVGGYGADLGNQHQTGLDDQFPALTPGETLAALAIDNDTPFISIAYNLLSRVSEDARDPGYVQTHAGHPFDATNPKFDRVDMWERGISGSRVSDAKTHGWDSIGGPRSPKQSYSAEHFGRAVNPLFDACFRYGWWSAWWMLQCKLGAIGSYGWPEFAGKSSNVWSPRAHAHVARAYVNAYLLTGGNSHVDWRGLADALFDAVALTIGSIAPDGMFGNHPTLPYMKLMSPAQGHGPFDEAWLRHWFCERPDGPRGTWRKEWSDAFRSGVKGEVIHDTLMQPAIKEAGVKHHKSQWYYWRGGLSGDAGSSSPTSGIAYHRFAGSVTVWMWAYVARAMLRYRAAVQAVDIAGPDKGASAGVLMSLRDHLSWVFIVASEGCGLIAPSKRGFLRDFQPRMPDSIDEHQSDYALARVTSEACYALASMYDGLNATKASRLRKAGASVYANCDRAKLSAPASVVFSEFWCALSQGIRL